MTTVGGFSFLNQKFPATYSVIVYKSIVFNIKYFIVTTSNIETNIPGNVVTQKHHWRIKFIFERFHCYLRMQVLEMWFENNNEHNTTTGGLCSFVR